MKLQRDKRGSEGCCAPAGGLTLDEAESERLASVLRALGEPTRLRILDLLSHQDHPLCVCEITPLFRQNQPTISHHLKLLVEAHLAQVERRGVWSYYSATEEGRARLQTLRQLAEATGFQHGEGGM